MTHHKPRRSNDARPAHHSKRPKISPFTLFGGFALASILVLILWVTLSLDWPLYLAWPLVTGAVTLAVYAFDKAQARNGAQRVPEVVLYALSLAGGFAGGFLAMIIGRHKTLHASFWVAQWLGLIMYAGVVWWLSTQGI